MLSPDDTPKTESSVEQSTRIPDSLSANSHQSVAPLRVEQETDAIPVIQSTKPASPQLSQYAKHLQRQNTKLREKNRQLQEELGDAATEIRVLTSSYNKNQSRNEDDVAAMQRHHSQQLEYYRKNLQESTKERNYLHESYKHMERRYQELYAKFTDSVEEETEKRLSDLAQTLVKSPEKVTKLLPSDALQTIELHIDQEKTRKLAEARYLTGEVQRITVHLEQEQLQLEEERQNLLRTQNASREQIELRRKMMQSHLRARWTIALTFNVFGSLIALIVLQYVFLFLLHVQIISQISFALIAPVVFCLLFAFALSRPISALRRQYKSAPHKKTVKK